MLSRHTPAGSVRGVFGVDHDDGQASLEWVALVALVAALLALGATMAHASFVGGHMTRAYARALCIVRGGDCARDLEPCVVASDERDASWSADVMFVRLGHGDVGILARRSDGTYAVTDAGRWSGGLTAGIGADFAVGGLSLDASADASAIAGRKGARTWIVPSLAAASRLLGVLRDDPGVAPPADFRQVDWDLATGYAADLGVEGESLAHGEREIADRRDSVEDRRTGHRTVTVSSQQSWGASILGLSGAGSAGGERYAVEVDREGRPLDLRIIATGAYTGARDLPGVVSAVAGLLDAPGGGDRRYEVTAHLDLTEPGNLAAARELVARVLRPVNVGWRPGAPQSLRRLIDARGTVEARVLDQVATSDMHGGHLALGEKYGFDRSTATLSVRLLAAASRGLDGQWITREDCVAAA